MTRMNPVVFVYKWNFQNEFLFLKIYIHRYMNTYIQINAKTNLRVCMGICVCVCVYPWNMWIHVCKAKKYIYIFINKYNEYK